MTPQSMNMRSPFVVSINDLPRHEGAQTSHEYSFSAPTGISIDLFRVPEGTPLSAGFSFNSVSEGVFVHGSVQAHAVGECARCLAPLELDLDERIGELVYYPEQAEAALVEDEDNYGDLDDIPTIDSDHIDLEPLIRDALVLAMPLQPLCSPECAGLCSECGRRWDELPADHAHEQLDPRFSALDALAEQLRGEGGDA